MKRKRGFYYYSKDEDIPKKRMKFMEDFEKIPFLYGRKIENSTEIDVFDQKNGEFEKVQKKVLNSEKHVILPSEFNKLDVMTSFINWKDEGEKIEEKVGFSNCNTDNDVWKTFGIRREGFKKWKFDFSEMNKMKKMNEIIEKIKLGFKERNDLEFSGKEIGSRSFIDEVLIKSLNDMGGKVKITTELYIEGHSTKGSLDYALFKDGVVATVVEAKEKDYKMGINQCLHQLKALHEQNENSEEKRNVYYGFSATDTFWVPIVYRPDKEVRWKNKINIGERYNVEKDDDLKKVVYMLRMIMSE